jgi:hypothetical protein
MPEFMYAYHAKEEAHTTQELCLPATSCPSLHGTRLLALQWCKRAGLEEQRLHEMAKLKAQFTVRPQAGRLAAQDCILHLE